MACFLKNEAKNDSFLKLQLRPLFSFRGRYFFSRQSVSNLGGSRRWSQFALYVRWQSVLESVDNLDLSWLAVGGRVSGCFLSEFGDSMCPCQFTVWVRHSSQLEGYVRISGQTVSEVVDRLYRSPVVVCVRVNEQSGSESGGSLCLASESVGSFGLSQMAVCVRVRLQPMSKSVQDH
jgi:hypothetical protein